MTDQKFAEFFAVMMGIFGHKWVLHYGEDPTGISARVWRDGLANLSLPQIAAGVRHFKNHSVTAVWPPSLPEFRSASLSLPTLAKVKFEIRNQTVTEFTPLVWRYLDAYRLRAANQDAADRMVAEAYELAVEAALSGEMANPTATALADESRQAENDLYDRLHLERLAEMRGEGAHVAD